MNQKEVLAIIKKAKADGRTKLVLSGEQLVSLPPEIGQLKNLNRLVLSHNQLGSLPPEIGKLTNLKELNLFNNQLSLLPPEIGQLKNLKMLDLEKNQLNSLPEEFGQLSNLMELDLSDNQLISLPPEFGQLTNLTGLYLSNNQVSSLPPEFGKLTNLIELDLSYNQLVSLPPEFGQLLNLMQLDLNDNQLSSLPPEFGQLTNLSEFYLFDNQLSSLPKEFGQLTSLKQLNLSFNQLSSLPPEFGKLKNLTHLQLRYNPLKSPPLEIVEQGTGSILAYLHELKKGAQKRYEAKLLILGDGSEGKTCVSRALRGLKFKKQVRTEGVEVAQWKFENPKFPAEKAKEITLNIWDFEGQEINHQSHQFFLTDKSLYLLVINGRKSFELERAEYWLDTIRSRAPQSRVILVATECENTTPSWPLDKLKANYNDLLQGENWFFIVGCQNNKGIDDLSTEIKTASANMDQMGMNWPQSYQKAEDIIKTNADSSPKVTRSELFSIFKDSGISEENFESIAEQMDILGTITLFKDCPDLEDFVVLNPQWLTKGISLVMEDEQLQKDKGEITHQRMKDIWEDGYSGLYPVLHSCMKEFELSYDMEDKAGCLVPLRFSDARPDIPWNNIPSDKERRIEYKLNAQPPYGIMSRFIVKTHYMIVKTDDMPKGVYWHNGVFLRTGHDQYTSEALCEFDHGNRTMRITVRAAFPQNMVEQLHGFAKAVFSFFEGLKPERRYGCKKFENEQEQECNGTHPERMILFALSRNKNVDCEPGWHEVDPKRLVYGFSSFGEAAVNIKELQKEFAKKPAWAEDIIADLATSLLWIDKIHDKVIDIRRKQISLPADIGQQVELKLRDYLKMFNEMLDNRDFNSAPAVVSIAPVDGSRFNPKNWFEKEYVLTPYCEYHGGVHKVDFCRKFSKPKPWWEKTAPKLALGTKILSAGIKIASAGLPLGIDAKILEEIEKEVEFMKELADYLVLEGGAESDISAESGELVKALYDITQLRDLRQHGGDDEKRIARMQLAELFKQIAPKEYKSRQWGTLQRVRMGDNTYRWLCPTHAAKYKN